MLHALLDEYTGRHVLEVAATLVAAQREAEVERMNSCLVELLEVARIHVFYNVDTAFLAHLNEVKRNAPTLVPVYEALFHILDTCARVRADAVALVDGFLLTDNVLNSSIGRADGSIYEGALAAVRHRTDPSSYFTSVIKPILESQQLE
ncbi:hypothetical protein PsorP6_018531 [Peronosclerospora sorghi]|nr:hypothetical protein PsorP6_018440 [Peronosclerospora sorghi]KAI9895544.1 hypothetical protein PsorP6_018531 [Peronosclerospora sorghi]